MAGPDGWIMKHGFKEVPEIPIDVVEKLNGQVIDEMRRRGQLPDKGEMNIKDFIERSLPMEIGLSCLINPQLCKDLWNACGCVMHPDTLECSGAI